MKWQPIETVPKDGRSVLVVSGAWITVAAWHRIYKMLISSGPVYAPYATDENPTHWMPLPEPPE